MSSIKNFKRMPSQTPFSFLALIKKIQKDPPIGVDEKKKKIIYLQASQRSFIMNDLLHLLCPAKSPWPMIAFSQRILPSLLKKCSKSSWCSDFWMVEKKHQHISKQSNSMFKYLGHGAREKNKWLYVSAFRRLIVL